jgi:hypothetical protein
MYDGFSKLPGFTAIKQDGLYVGIEDPYFSVIRVCCQSPDCVECSERASSFLNSFCHISVHASIVLADYTAQIGNSDTCSICWSLRKSGWLLGVWMRISFVLLMLIFRPTLAVS